MKPLDVLALHASVCQASLGELEAASQQAAIVGFLKSVHSRSAHKVKAASGRAVLASAALLRWVQEPLPGLARAGACISLGKGPLCPEPFLGPVPHFILLIKFFPNWIILGFLPWWTFTLFPVLCSMWVLEGIPSASRTLSSAHADLQTGNTRVEGSGLTCGIRLSGLHFKLPVEYLW